MTLLFSMTSCAEGLQKPLRGINSTLLKSSVSQREPSVSTEWITTLSNEQGKERVELINLRTRKKVALPGLNRADSQPISASISADGQKIALIRQRGNQTELLIYRRNTGTVQIIEISPKGIPRKVSIDGAGRLVAVQVSRNGRWDIDLIQIPN